MPVLAIPALVAVAAALIALMAVYAIAYLVKIVGHMMPDWSLPGYSQLRAYVLASAAIALDAIRNAMTAALAPIGRVIEYPVTVATHLFDALVENIGRAVSTLHWVVNTYVPHLVANLRADARTWVNNLTDRLTRVAAATLAHAIAWARLHVANLAARLDRIVVRIDTRVGSLADRVGRVLTRALAAAAAAEVHAVSRAEGYTDRAIHNLAGRVTDVAGAVRAGVQTAETYADRAVRAGVDTAETYATKAAGAAAAGLAASAAVAAAPAWGRITDEATSLAGVLGADLPGIGAAVRAIPKVDVSDLPGVLTGVATAVLPALRFMETCGIPNCRNLSAFGRDLQQFLGLLGDAELIALLARMITDPAGAAADVSSVGNVVEGIVSDATSLLGVA